MQDQEKMEASIAAKKQEMNDYLDVQKKIKKSGYGRAGYLRFFENGLEITNYYNRLVEDSTGEKQKGYQEAQRIFNEKLNANVKLLIDYRKQTYIPKEDADESSREFEQLAQLCELDQKPPEQREEAVKQFVAKWFTITVLNLEDYKKCTAHKEALGEILAFVSKKHPKDTLLISELEKGGQRLITAQKNFIKRQIVFLDSREKTKNPSLLEEAKEALRLIADDESFENEKKLLKKAIERVETLHFCEKNFLNKPHAIPDRLREITSKDTNPFKAAIQKFVRGNDIARLQKCIRENILNDGLNTGQCFDAINSEIDDLLKKMKRKSKFGRIGMENFEAMLMGLKAELNLKTEIAKASQPVPNFGEKLSAAKSELRERPAEQGVVGKSLLHTDISNASDADDVERAKNDNSNVEEERSRPTPSQGSD